MPHGAITSSLVRRVTAALDSVDRSITTKVPTLVVNLINGLLRPNKGYSKTRMINGSTRFIKIRLLTMYIAVDSDY